MMKLAPCRTKVQPSMLDKILRFNASGNSKPLLTSSTSSYMRIEKWPRRHQGAAYQIQSHVTVFSTVQNRYNYSTSSLILRLCPNSAPPTLTVRMGRAESR